MLSLSGFSVGATPSPTVPPWERGTISRPERIVDVGKYRFELRLPDDGLYAGETVDVEFRISDLTQNDAIEGKKGVVNAQPTALITMPSMEGMPVVRPKIHGEGVPGDYGLELFFPHGGDFKISILAKPPGGKPILAAFTVSVKDAEDRRAKAAAPFSVSVLDFPAHAKAGELLDLRVAVKDNATKEVVHNFDLSHTKLLHLMLVSKDLGWFVHEHPVQQADGSFEIKQSFPAGGTYLVFADSAPRDKGSQILSTQVHIEGPKASWPTKLTLTKRASGGGIQAEVRPQVNPIPIGMTTSLSFFLKDQETKKPVTDLQPYLGAQGHLMIIHQDGKIFVHSHPSDDKSGRKGEVRFNARFPKAGIYKAWVQFQRKGRVITLPFVFKVK